MLIAAASSRFIKVVYKPCIKKVQARLTFLYIGRDRLGIPHVGLGMPDGVSNSNH